MTKVSIIVVTKNAGATLERCILSVAAQSYKLKELLIIDGASDDDTPTIVKKQRSAIARFISEPDDGIYAAMNKGIKLATGDLIYFLGADDFLVDSEVLTDVLSFFDQNSDCDFGYGGILVRSKNGQTHEFLPPVPHEVLGFLVSGCLPHQASFVTRRGLGMVGGFNEQYQFASDYDWFIRAATHPQLVIKRFNRIVASYYAGGRSSQSANPLQEVIAIQNTVALYQAPYWLKLRASIFRREIAKHRVTCHALRYLNSRVNGGSPWKSALGLLHSVHREALLAWAFVFEKLPHSGDKTEQGVRALQMEYVRWRLLREELEGRLPEAGTVVAN